MMMMINVATWLGGEEGDWLVGLEEKGWGGGGKGGMREGDLSEEGGA